MGGKSGVVIGAASGIGRASAIAFARAGAKVMIADFIDDKSVETLRMIREEGGTAEAIHCDIRNESQVKATVEATISAFGRIDFAHNNVAICHPHSSIYEMDTAVFSNVISTNITGTFLCMKYEGAAMVAQGGGAIVCTSSGAGTMGCAGQTPYAASKAAINNMVKTAALDMGRFGVRVNAIMPGPTFTPMLEEFLRDYPSKKEEMLSAIPRGQAATPEEQANVAVFLCSDMASHVNGVLVPVDGGYLAGYYTRPQESID